MGIAAISYDSEPILKDFAKRHGITYPLLADPHSELIARFGVLNQEAKGLTKGMSYPGYFYVTPDGRIKEALFETAYTDRFTPNNVLLKLFPELAEGVSRSVSAPHVALTLSQSDQLVAAGSRITVAVDVTLPQGVHVYAPGVTGYKPILLQLGPGDWRPLPAAYPESKLLSLPAIRETVPVFEGHFRITQDLVVASNPAFVKSIGNGRKKLTVGGTLQYQACDETICFPPVAVPVSWDTEVVPLDLQRAPEAIQHK